jgi:hypothetical protein
MYLSSGMSHQLLALLVAGFMNLCSTIYAH